MFGDHRWVTLFTFAVVFCLIVGLNCLTDSVVLFEKNSLSEKQGKEEKDAAWGAVHGVELCH